MNHIFMLIVISHFHKLHVKVSQYTFIKFYDYDYQTRLVAAIGLIVRLQTDGLRGFGGDRQPPEANPDDFNSLKPSQNGVE